MRMFCQFMSVCMQHFRQVEAVRRIKGEECRYEVDRIEEECVSELTLIVFLVSFILMLTVNFC